jgi:peptidoglycan/LPS O-acetylase OafA/YrhL
MAIAFFSVTRLAKLLLGDNANWHPTLTEWLQNLTLTQWLSDLRHPVAWPGDNRTLFVAAFWSLNYEEQFYFVVGIALILAQRFNFGIFRSVVLLGILGITWNFVIPGGKLYGVFIEYWVHFAMGSALYFVLCERVKPLYRAAFLTVIAFIAIYCVIHIVPFRSTGAFETPRRAYFELLLLSAMSILLFYARPFSDLLSSSLAWRPVAAIGTISYSLYLVHQFNLTLVGSVTRFLLPTSSPSLMVTFVQILCHIGVASVTCWAIFGPIET